MNPTLPLWVLSLQSLTAPMSVPLRMPEVQRFETRWAVQFAPVLRNVDERGRAADAEQEQSVRRVEALLSTAKTALGALRHAEVDSALAEADALIRAHSELPQAAWLLAEHHVIFAERLLDEDANRAREFSLSAGVLEGERAEAFRDTTGAASGLALPLAREVPVSGLFSRDELEWDGERIHLPLVTRPGEHHARVLRGERLLWSGWIQVAEATPAVALSLPAPLPCSDDDLAATLDSEQGPRALPGTLCSDWAVARVKGGELVMARCQANHCGPWQTASLGHGAERSPPSAKGTSGMPRWLTYAAVGAGTALIASIVLVQSGAFSSSEPTRDRWMYAGFK